MAVQLNETVIRGDEVSQDGGVRVHPRLMARRVLSLAMATTIVAAYAAFVATVTLGWQIWTHSQSKRPQVALLVDDWHITQARGRQSLEDVMIRVRNREDYAVAVERLQIGYPWSFPRLRVSASIEDPEATHLPIEVGARDIMSLTIRPTRDFRISRQTGYSSSSEFWPAVTLELRTGERYRGRLTR